MYLGPTDLWPKHSRPLARAALEEARAAGWWFKSSDKGHAFGRLRCKPPSEDPDGIACKLPVYSTSGSHDGSDTARVIRDAVRKCPHTRKARGGAPDAEANARLAAGALAQTRVLVQAADRLLRSESARGQADILIEDALTALSSGNPIADLEDRIRELERESVTEGQRSHSAAIQAGAGDPWPPTDGARELIDLAEQKLTEAQDLLAASKGSADFDALHVESAALNVEIERLSSMVRE